ncbi:hypothetical protein EON82_25530, partial [bacterium]
MYRPRPLLAILMMLSVLVSAFGRGSVGWACEGRVCSSDAARCCCASPLSSRDSSCDTAFKKPTGACAGECSCTSVLTKAAEQHAFQAPKAIAFAVQAMEDAPAAPPFVFVPQAYFVLETPQVRAIPP